MDRFANLTNTFIKQGKIERAKKCLVIAENLYLKGTGEMQNAIAVVYVFSVSSYFELSHCSIRNLFPQAIMAIYNHQVNASSI